jgi:predicted unusual protein kinase regulating ubiquinone biosynthesis (AarF/ABC1/UbiB family)
MEYAGGNTLAQKQRIVEAAESYLSEYRNGQLRTVRVHTFEHFLKEWRGQWVELSSIGESLTASIQKNRGGQRKFVVVDPQRQAALQHEINTYIRQFGNRAVWIAEEKLQQSGMHEVARDAVAQLQNLIVADAGLEAVEAMLESLARKIEVRPIEALKALGTEIAEKAFRTTNSSKMSEQARRKLELKQKAMKVLFSEYYGRLGWEYKKDLISAVLGAQLDMDKVPFFALLIKKSGPYLRKAIQGASEETNLDPELEKVFEMIQSDNLEIEPSLVEKMLADELGNYDFIRFSRKPLGIGSMAQNNEAVVRYQGRDVRVAVRFEHPVVEKWCPEEERVFLEIGAVIDASEEFRRLKAPRIMPWIEDMIRGVRYERDLEGTRARQQMGREVYPVDERVQRPGESPLIVKIRVPIVIFPKGPSKVFVSGFAPGKKLNKLSEFLETYPSLPLSVFETLAGRWMTRVLYDTRGFYHSDPHPGNYMVEMGESEVTLTLIDYGMGGRIKPGLQDLLIVLGAADEMKEPRVLGESLWRVAELGDQPPALALKERFLEAVSKEYQEIQLGRAEARGLENWVIFATDYGLDLPFDFGNMARGAGYIQRSLEKLKSRETLESLVIRKSGWQAPRIIKVLLKSGLPLKKIARLAGESMLIKIGLIPNRHMVTPRCLELFLGHDGAPTKAANQGR